MPAPIPGASDIEDALAGRRGDVHISYRYEQRSSTYAFEDNLTDAIYGASISNDNTRTVGRTARFSIDAAAMPVAFDPLADHIAPIATLDVPMYVAGVAGAAPHWEAVPVDIAMGLFHLDAPVRTYSENGREFWEVQASDLKGRLLTAKTTTSYFVASGTNYMTAVRAIFTLLGLLHSFPNVAATTPVDFIWAPGKSYAEIVDSLLFGINYYPAWADGVGVFTSRERINPATETAVATYRTTAEPRMVLSPFQKSEDASRWANRVVCVIDDPRRTAAYVVKVNDDPTSPISTVALGGVVNPDPAISGGRVVDITTVAAVVDFELRDRAAHALRGSLRTFADPRRGPHEFYALTIGTVEVGTLWEAFGWSLELRTGAEMSHDIGRAQAVALSIVLTLSGTILTATETNIVSGGRTIILTLPTGYTWVAAGATFDAQRAAIIAGLTSGASEATGWNAVVKPAIGVGDVVRTSATIVTITLPAVATYNIAAPETITVVVPDAAITGAPSNVTEPPFTIVTV